MDHLIFLLKNLEIVYMMQEFGLTELGYCIKFSIVMVIFLFLKVFQAMIQPNDSIE